MNRVRQEFAEVYVIDGADLVKALGIEIEENDRIIITRESSRTGDFYRIKIEGYTEESIEIPTPDGRDVYNRDGAVEAAVALGGGYEIVPLSDFMRRLEQQSDEGFYGPLGGWPAAPLTHFVAPQNGDVTG